jgi:hypothetical protein
MNSELYFSVPNIFLDFGTDKFSSVIFLMNIKKLIKITCFLVVTRRQYPVLVIAYNTVIDGSASSHLS